MQKKTMADCAHMFTGDFRLVVFARSLPIARRMIRQDFRTSNLRYIGKGQPSASDAGNWMAANIMDWS